MITKIPRSRGTVLVAAVLVLAGIATAAATTYATTRPTPAPRPAATDAPLRSLAQADGVYLGTAVAAGDLTNDSYATIAGGQFDSVTPESEMKWATVEPSQGVHDWSRADRIVDFAQAHRMLVRGHTLVWHNRIPDWVTNGHFTTDQLKALLKQHIVDEVSHFQGRIYAWDVVNEAFNDDGTLRHDIWYDTLGPDYIADAFRWAHEADPAAKLYINDYGTEYQGPKSTALYDLVKSLRSQGVPIDGVGFQSHFAAGRNPDLAATLSRFAALGVAVAVTELDDRVQLPVTSAELAQQATDYATAVRACLGVRGCAGVSVWEFDDGHSWIPGFFPGVGAADLYDREYHPKPAYRSVQAALAAGRG